MTAFDLVREHILNAQGFELDYWDEFKPLPISDWKTLVASNDTRQGYWEWIASNFGLGEQQ